MTKKSENFDRQETLEAFGAALRKRREEKGLTLEALARVTGISKPYLANIETARTPGPPTEAKLRVLEKALGIEQGDLVMAADWLRTPASVRALLEESLPRRADGAIDLDAIVKKRAAPQTGGQTEALAGDTEKTGEQEERLAIRIAPVINRVAAGIAVEHGDLDYPAGVADAYVPVPAALEGSGGGEDEQAAWKNAFACRVSGASMEPLYKDGDLVVVAPLEARDGEDCLVRLGEAENFATTLKRVYFLPDHSGQAMAIRLVPRNTTFAERVVTLGEVTGLYPVIYRMSSVRGKGAEKNADVGSGSDGAYGDRV